MLLIYTHKITPRFVYTMRHVFERMLNTDVDFTTKVEEFIAHTGPKITYTRQPLQSEFFIRSHDLLFEQGLSEREITVHDWEGVPCFFTAGDKSALPFDVFAATFYLLSRYEEYLPHVKDEHGKYAFEQSLAFTHNFLKLPVVDLWIKRLKRALVMKFPDFSPATSSFKQLSLIDVAVSTEYSGRGIIRTLAGYMMDLGNFRFRRIWNRSMVLLGLKKDPFNNFERLVALHKKVKAKIIFFFLLADYSTYDKNISVNSNRQKNLIKWIADYSIVSLMASYRSVDKPELLRIERKRLIDLIHRPVKRIRFRFNRVVLPEVYQNLVEAEFNEDYSMGYDKALGFRAGTCTPFYFYDISHENQLPIKINPFCVHSTALSKMGDQKTVADAIKKIKQNVEDVEGTFITVFLNDFFGFKEKVNWNKIYGLILKEEHV